MQVNLKSLAVASLIGGAAVTGIAFAAVAGTPSHSTHAPASSVSSHDAGDDSARPSSSPTVGVDDHHRRGRGATSTSPAAPSRSLEPTHSRSAVPTTGVTTEPDDDNGHGVEPGDDNGQGVEPGDDNGGRRDSGRGDQAGSNSGSNSGSGSSNSGSDDGPGHDQGDDQGHGDGGHGSGDDHGSDG